MGEDFTPEDTLAVTRAGIDQLIAFAPEMARGAFSLFSAYSEEGFTSAQALHLTTCVLFQEPGTPPA